MTSVAPRDVNRVAVLSSVLRDGAWSRNAVAQTTGLSKATVSRIVDDLLSDGHLVETQLLPAEGKGRPTRRILGSPSLGFVSGIDIGLLTTKVVLLGVNGVEIRRRSFPTSPSSTPAEFSAWLKREWRETLAGSGWDPLLLRGQAVALPGPPLMGGRSGVDETVRTIDRLARHAIDSGALQDAPVRTRLTRDVDMSLLGELADGSVGDYTTVALIMFSARVGASVAIDGSLMTSPNGLIGEVGLLAFDDERTLQDVVGANELVRSINANDDSAHWDLDAIIAARVDALPAVVRRDLIAGITGVITGMCIYIDPPVIVITGRLAPLVERLLPFVREKLRQTLPSLPALRISTGGGFAGARGSAQLARMEELDLVHVRVVAGIPEPSRHGQGKLPK